MATIDTSSGQFRVGDRSLVITSGNVFYGFAVDVGTDPAIIEAHKSSDGSSWAEQDAGDAPEGHGTAARNAVAAAINSSAVVQTLFWKASGGLYLCTFTPSTDQWGTPSSISAGFGANTSNAPVAIAVDNSDGIHILASNNIKYMGTWYQTVKYGNNIGGWAFVELYGQAGTNNGRSGGICVVSDIPYIVYQKISDGDIVVGKGNARDATSFTEYTVDATVDTGSDGIAGVCGDSGGNIWIVFKDSDGSIDIAKIDSDFLGASIYSTGDTGSYPSIMADGTDIHVIYIDSSDNVCRNMYNGSSWEGKTTLHTGTYLYPRFLWANYNNHEDPDTEGISYTYLDSTGFYYGNFSVTAATPQSLVATTTPSVSLTNKPKKKLAATTTPSAAFVKKITHALTATTTPAAGIAKKVAEVLAATSTGLAGIVKKGFVSLAATSAGSASLVNVAKKVLAATTTPTVAFIKKTTHSLIATTTSRKALCYSRLRVWVRRYWARSSNLQRPWRQRQRLLLFW
jgi:hypothetical protein